MMAEINVRFGRALVTRPVLGAMGALHHIPTGYLVHVIGVQALAFGPYRSVEAAEDQLDRLEQMGRERGYEALMRAARWTFSEVPPDAPQNQR